jgi:hypothetical protein
MRSIIYTYIGIELVLGAAAILIAVVATHV